jgi:hypothetical protein
MATVALRHSHTNNKDVDVLYGCETWSLTLRKEHGLRVFENRVLRRIFGPTMDKVTGMEKVAQWGAS